MTLNGLVARVSMAVGRSLPDIPMEHSETIRKVARFTMTSRERLAALISATEYVVRAGIPGAIAECGVWAGGSMMAVAETLIRLGDNRELYLYDTFEGMPAPSERDRTVFGESAIEKYRAMRSVGRKWDYAPLARVRANLASTGWPSERVHYVKGRVEETLPGQAPEALAVLRIDTDWYESTRHELEHLYPRLEPGGVLIVDDYGHWAGARAAVDDYFAERPTYLHRIDYTGRLAIKR